MAKTITEQAHAHIVAQAEADAVRRVAGFLLRGGSVLAMPPLCEPETVLALIEARDILADRATRSKAQKARKVKDSTPKVTP